MQATMLKALLLPQSGTTTTILPISHLYRPLFISGHRSLRLLQAEGTRRTALWRNWKSYSIRAISNETNSEIDKTTNKIKRSDYPQDFFFGTASSAYQFEGAPKEGGKGVSNWDQFTHRHPNMIKDGTNADVAVDSYHRYKEHVALMKGLGVNSYRFSIAWTRILPTGKLSGGVNEEGIRYYNNLIDELLSQGIQPFVTIFHWDIPQALEDEYGGFLNSKIINDFKDYVNICFKRFGDRVKHWITLNEPFVFTLFGYIIGAWPAGPAEDPGRHPYMVGHNLLLAHAAAVDLYRSNYQESQMGKIGITLNCEDMIPSSNEQADIEAAARAFDFQFGWFMHPVTFGDYPESMKHLVRKRLPNFSTKESLMLEGSYDFLGLNYYTGVYVTEAPPASVGSHATDGCYKLSSRLEGVPIGPPTGSDWMFIYPQGLREVLLSIKEKYNDPVFYITENGISDHSSLTMEESLKDDLRVNSLRDHLFYLKSAMDAGANVKGYFAWSLLDNYEWHFGYTVRFGIHYVDYNDDLKIYPKNSAIWYKNFLSS